MDVSQNLFTEEAEIATRGWMHSKGDKGETRYVRKGSLPRREFYDTIY